MYIRCFVFLEQNDSILIGFFQKLLIPKVIQKVNAEPEIAFKFQHPFIAHLASLITTKSNSLYRKTVHGNWNEIVSFYRIT